MTTESPHRLLFCAFAEVPGPSSSGTRVEQILSSLSDDFEIDGFSLTGRELLHIERFGPARMMRVPVDDKPFLERLLVYQRALSRQLLSDTYQLVYCADLFSAEIAALYQKAQGFSLLFEVGDLPARSFEKRYPVEASDQRLRKEWREGERRAFRAATRILAPSRHAARLLGKEVDPRFLRLLPRAVDRTVFAPPSVELSLDERRTVLVIGGREGGPMLAPVVGILTELARVTDPARVRLLLAGTPGDADGKVKGALDAAGLKERVALVDTGSAVRLANALSNADVIVVPSKAEIGLEPFAVPHRALEAMACRRAVIVTGPEAVFADAFVPGEEALVVPPGAPAQVAEAVQRLVESPALRESVAQAGLRRVEQQADLRTFLKQLGDLFEEVLGVSVKPRAPKSTLPAEKRAPEKPHRRVEGAGARVPLPAEAAAPAEEGGGVSGDTQVADPHSGVSALKTFRAVSLEGESARVGVPAGSDEWYGDTRIDESAPGMPRDTTQRTTSPGEVTPPFSTITASSPPARSLRAFAAPPAAAFEAEGDPWAPDTIADASPFPEGEESGKRPRAEDGEPTDKNPVRRSSGSAKSFLVDADKSRVEGEMTLEDAPAIWEQSSEG